MLLLQDFSVKLFSNYKKTIGMSLPMNVLRGATNTLRQPWYERFFLFAVFQLSMLRLRNFDIPMKASKLMLSTFEISTVNTRCSLPKKLFLNLIPTSSTDVIALRGCFRGG